MKEKKHKRAAFYAVFIFAIICLAFAANNFLQARERGELNVEAQAVSNEGARDIAMSFFDDYASWPSSETPIQPDNKRYMLSLYYTDTAPILTDINGDNLVDLLYYNGAEYGIFLNNGNNEVEPVYMCRRAGVLWYGDCADVK